MIQVVQKLHAIHGDLKLHNFLLYHPPCATPATTSTLTGSHTGADTGMDTPGPHGQVRLCDFEESQFLDAEREPCNYRPSYRPPCCVVRLTPDDNHTPDDNESTTTSSSSLSFDDDSFALGLSICEFLRGERIFRALDPLEPGDRIHPSWHCRGYRHPY